MPMPVARPLRALIAISSLAGAAQAQTYELNAATIRFQVFDPAAAGGLGAWSSTRTAFPGQQVEWRAVVSYTGTRTDLVGLGEALYQPTVSNTDNTGTGAAADQIGAWRNNGNSGYGLPGSLLTTAEGNSGAALPSYGRVRFGGTGATQTGSNTHTLFRHSGGSDGAPGGTWMRIGGSSVTQWPRELNFPVPPLDVVPNDINRILLGMSAFQVSQSLDPTNHISDTQNLVVLRQALVLSTDTAARTMQIGTFRESFRRVGGISGATEADDRRYFTWQTSATDVTGSHRTLEPTIIPATITFIPAPGSLGVCALGVAWASRRRRTVHGEGRAR